MIQRILVWIFGIIGGLLIFNSLVGSLLLDTWEFDDRVIKTNLIVSMIVGIVFSIIAVIIDDNIDSMKKSSSSIRGKDDTISIDCKYCGASFEPVKKSRNSRVTDCPNCGGPNKLKR